MPESYELSPVLPGMIAAFMDCIGKQYAITDLKVEGRGDVITNEFTINGAKLTLYFIARDKRISLHCDDKQLLKRIGEYADKELAKGNFQKEFGQFDFD